MFILVLLLKMTQYPTQWKEQILPSVPSARFVTPQPAHVKHKMHRKGNYFYDSKQLRKYIPLKIPTETMPPLNMLTSAYGNTIAISDSGAEALAP
jgi:hypothetical protein